VRSSVAGHPFDEAVPFWDTTCTMSKQAPSQNPATKVRLDLETTAAAKTRTAFKAKSTRKAKLAKKAETVPYHHKPESLSFEEWQTALRKQFVPEKGFKIEKLSDTHQFFGDYSVFNPESGRSYKIALRDGGSSLPKSPASGLNYCDCLDFKTNRLGTCKHIEAVIRTVGKKRGARKAFKDGYVPPYTAVYLYYGEARQVRIRIGTDNAEQFAALARDYFDDKYVLKPKAGNQIETFLQKAAAIDGGFRCYDDALAFILAERESDRRRELVTAKYSAPESLDGLLKTKLYPYQRSGILFAVEAGRALIADEMGLGKTIQAIGVAELLKREASIERVLVVCPTSLKYQWRSEIMKFSDSSVGVIEGSSLVREKQYREGCFYKIVSYHALLNDTKAIARMAPDLVILDEAQRIKNWKTRIAKTVKSIESPFALVLTGTPLENNLEELYSIVSFIDHYKLGPFWKFLAEHQVKDEGGKVTGYRGLQEIGKMLSSITLRRRKSEVLRDLPGRIEKRIFIPMTVRQREVHEEFRDAVALLVFKWRRLGHLSEQDRQRLLILLNQMRMSCDSTYILDQDLEHRHDVKIGELMSILEESLADPEQKVVVFSQWERMTRLVNMELEQRGIGYRSLNGSVPGVKRKELFDSFNTIPECRVFVSTDAGSTGLNLQAASIIVNLDMPWNPAVLEQRIGRIHRIGQKKNITVLNFVSIDTIESRMLDLIGFKSALAHGILDSGEDSIFMGNAEHGRFMNAVEEIVTMPENEAVAMETDILEVDDALSETGKSSRPGALPEPAELVMRGVSFFADLSRSLSAPGGAEALVKALSGTDPDTGKTYLKIPVEDPSAAADALSMLAGLFSALSSSTKTTSVNKDMP